MGILDKRLQKASEKLLTKMGVDISNPKKTIKDAIENMIHTSVPKIFRPEEMISFLNEKIMELKQYK